MYPPRSYNRKQRDFTVVFKLEGLDPLHEAFI
jgi:hypothetical protein